MPRKKGSKNLTVGEKMAAVEKDIETLQAALKTKKAELKKLREEKEAEEKTAVFNAIIKSGKSVDDVLEMIRNGK